MEVFVKKCGPLWGWVLKAFEDPFSWDPICLKSLMLRKPRPPLYFLTVQTSHLTLCSIWSEARSLPSFHKILLHIFFSYLVPNSVGLQDDKKKRKERTMKWFRRRTLPTNDNLKAFHLSSLLSILSKIHCYLCFRVTPNPMGMPGSLNIFPSWIDLHYY